MLSYHSLLTTNKDHQWQPIIFLVRPLNLTRNKGHRRTLPSSPVLGPPLQRLPRQPFFLYCLFCGSAPGGSQVFCLSSSCPVGSTSAPVYWFLSFFWVYDLSTSISSSRLHFNWVLLFEFPQVGIRDGVGPVYSLEASEAPGDEVLQLIEYGGGISLTVTASQYSSEILVILFITYDLLLSLRDVFSQHFYHVTILTNKNLTKWSCQSNAATWVTWQVLHVAQQCRTLF